MMEMASRMTQEKFKAPNSSRRKRTVSASSFVEMNSGPPHRKKKRTSDDFLQFCTMVLSYTQYDSPTTPQSPAELRAEYNSSPLGSTGTADSFLSESSNLSYTSEQENNSYDNDDEDSMDLISCFCMKPYSGRPMIECNDCSVWIHLSCAKIRKANIPDEYTCPKCRTIKSSVRKSLRTKLDEKQMLV